MHASLHKSRRENHRRVVFTQQDTIYSRAHLVLTNLLITSLLVLCFSRWFLLFLPPNILLISCHPRLLFWYLLFRYRWAHHLCFLSMNDLSRSSFFDILDWSGIIWFTLRWNGIISHPGFASSYSVITTESLLLWSQKIGQLIFLPYKLDSFKDVACQWWYLILSFKYC